jgi:hypothetical protein
VLDLPGMWVCIAKGVYCPGASSCRHASLQAAGVAQFVLASVLLYVHSGNVSWVVGQWGLWHVVENLWTLSGDQNTVFKTEAQH